MKTRFQVPGILALSPDAWGLEFDYCGIPAAAFDVRGDFAVVSVNGPLMQRATWCFDSYDAITARVEEACKSDRPALLLKLSSPGGQVAGCFELVAWIRSRAAEAGKRVVAYVDGLAASAAYAIACAADRIVVPPTGVAGSIGCIQVNVDTTAWDRAAGMSFEMITSGARKADGNPHVSLSEDARAAIQTGVNDMASTFFSVVGAARGKSPAEIAALEAGVFVGAKAVAAGLADDVMTLSELVAAGPEKANTGAAGADGGQSMNMKEIRSALEKAAESDDEKEAARAKKALAALDDEESDDDKDKDEKAESSDEDKGDDEDKDEKKDDAKASTSASLDLAAQVQALTARLSDIESKEERSKLMASRPDLAKEVVAFLDRQPIEVVRDAVKTLPKGAAKGQVNAARAALSVTPSEATPTAATGAGQLPPDEHEKVLAQMGIRPSVPKPDMTVRSDGSVEFRRVLPSEARAREAKGQKAEG